MRDNKAFASLSSSLLARKGAARPAMRPQGFSPLAGGTAIDDLGWNDMGDGAHAMPPLRREIDVRLPASLSGPQANLPEQAPVPTVVRQQDEIAREFAAPEAVVSEPTRAKPAPIDPVSVACTAGRKAAFTLRLDPDRHLRLRLACAVEHRSAQQLVTDALDRLLATLPEVERLAASLPPGGGTSRAD